MPERLYVVAVSIAAVEKLGFAVRAAYNWKKILILIVFVIIRSPTTEILRLSR